ncbi:MAG TPA: hypothetical protein VII34_09305 [Pyrinomonadaceae bacterium]
MEQRSLKKLATSQLKTRVAKLPDKARRLNDLAIRRALELAGIEFIDENGGGPGLGLRKRPQKKR